MKVQLFNKPKKQILFVRYFLLCFYLHQKKINTEGKKAWLRAIFLQIQYGLDIVIFSSTSYISHKTITKGRKWEFPNDLNVVSIEKRKANYCMHFSFNENPKEILNQGTVFYVKKGHWFIKRFPIEEFFRSNNIFTFETRPVISKMRALPLRGSIGPEQKLVIDYPKEIAALELEIKRLEINKDERLKQSPLSDEIVALNDEIQKAKEHLLFFVKNGHVAYESVPALLAHSKIEDAIAHEYAKKIRNLDLSIALTDASEIVPTKKDQLFITQTKDLEELVRKNDAMPAIHVSKKIDTDFQALCKNAQQRIEKKDMSSAKLLFVFLKTRKEKDWVSFKESVIIPINHNFFRPHRYERKSS